MDNINLIKHTINNSITLTSELLSNPQYLEKIADIASVMIKAYRNDRKVLLCGNGGSAADAQHIAAELSGRFYKDRPPLHAEALHTNSSYLTAVANDYTFDEVFSRLVKAMGRKGDILLGISTSGNSENVINALDQANRIGITTIGLTGGSGGKMIDICKYTFCVPSNDTARIQEIHILIGHILCEIIEKELFE